MLKSQKVAEKYAAGGDDYDQAEDMKVDVQQRKPDEREKYGGLTKAEVEEAERLIDPEQALKAQNISRKANWREIKKVIEASDVIVHVLDARDPNGTKSKEVEDAIKAGNKKVIYVLNKVDLVPEDNSAGWLQKYKAQKFLCVPYRANLSSKSEEAKESNGQEKLMTFLYKYAKKFIEKKEVESIRVGVVGMPNVGKSSLVNILRGKPVCSSGSTPFITKSPQEVKLNSLVTLVDTPGVLTASGSVIRSAVQVDDIVDPVEPIEDLLTKVEKTEILRHYRIANFKDVDEMLSHLAHKKGLVSQEVIYGEKG